VFEPKLALELRPDRYAATRVVANVAARIRERSVLEGYDTMDPAQTDADAKVFLDVGSEAVAGVAGVYEVTPRVAVAVEAQAFVPLPDAATYGDCRRFNGDKCSTIGSADYFGDAKHGDLTTLVTLGTKLRLTADLTASAMIGTGQLGARGDDFRITTGLVWAPQPLGAAAPGRHDRDNDGVPDSLDACAEEPEDKDGYQDEDGCPDLDNDSDGIADAADKCPLQAETINGVKDDDGCPDTGGLEVARLDGDRLMIDRVPALSGGALSTAGNLIVDQLALVMLAHPEVTKWLVVLAQPKAEAAQKLADAVKARLIAKGVPAARLEVRSAVGEAKIGGVVQERGEVNACPKAP